MDCAVCFNKYDNEKHKPYSITPCGHCFCLQCLNSLTNKKCPVDRIDIESKVVNRGIMDLITSPSSNKSKSILTALKKSLITEMKKLEKEMGAACSKKLKYLDELAESIRVEIEKDKIEKIQSLERDAKTLLYKLDEVKKNFIKQCNDEVNANFFSQVIKSSQKLVQEADSSKAATENSENIKKQMRQKIKILEEIGFQFQSNQKVFNENTIGHIIEKKMPLIERSSFSSTITLPIELELNRSTCNGIFSNTSQQSNSSIFGTTISSNTASNTNSGNSLGQIKSSSFVDLRLHQPQSQVTFGMPSIFIHKRKSSDSSQDDIQENTAKRTALTSSDNSNLSENIAPSTSSGPQPHSFQMKPSLLQSQSTTSLSKLDSKQPKQMIVNEKDNPFYKHFKNQAEIETTTKTLKDPKKNPTKTNGQSTNPELSSHTRSTMESNLPVVPTIRSTNSTTSSQTVNATTNKNKPLSHPIVIPNSPLIEVANEVSAAPSQRTSTRRISKVEKYPK